MGFSFLLSFCGRKHKPTPTLSEKPDLYARPASIRTTSSTVAVPKPITVASGRKSNWPLSDETRTPRVTERPTTPALTLTKTRSLSPPPVVVVEKPVYVQTPVVDAEVVKYEIDTTPLSDAEVAALYTQRQVEFQKFVQEAYVEDCNTKEGEEIIRQIRQYGRHEAFQDTKFPQLLLETWFWMRVKHDFEKDLFLPAHYRAAKKNVAEGDRPAELAEWRALEINRIARSTSVQDHLEEHIDSICCDIEDMTKTLQTNTHLPKRRWSAYQAEQKERLRAVVAQVVVTMVQWEAQRESFKFIYPSSAGWLEPGKIENIAKRGVQRDSVLDGDEDRQGRFSGGIVVPMLVRQKGTSRDYDPLETATILPAFARMTIQTAAEKRWSGTIDTFVSARQYDQGAQSW